MSGSQRSHGCSYYMHFIVFTSFVYCIVCDRMRTQDCSDYKFIVATQSTEQKKKSRRNFVGLGNKERCQITIEFSNHPFLFFRVMYGRTDRLARSLLWSMRDRESELCLQIRLVLLTSTTGSVSMAFLLKNGNSHTKSAEFTVFCCQLLRY